MTVDKTKRKGQIQHVVRTINGSLIRVYQIVLFMFIVIITNIQTHFSIFSETNHAVSYRLVPVVLSWNQGNRFIHLMSMADINNI